VYWICNQQVAGSNEYGITHWRKCWGFGSCTLKYVGGVRLAVPAAENNTTVGLARSMASAGARAYNGGLGAERPAMVQGAQPPVGSQGQSSPEADGILVLEHTFLRSPGGFLHSCRLYPTHCAQIGL